MIAETSKPDTLIFRCRHCGAPIGAQTDAALIVGAVRFAMVVTMECLICRRTVRWRPAPKISLMRNIAAKDVAQNDALGVES
jgi:hypothetical protein